VIAEAQPMQAKQEAARLGSSERTVIVWALGLASLAIYYFALTLPYSLIKYYATPLLDLAKINHHTYESGWNLIGAFIALFLIYGVVWLLMPRVLQVGRGLALAIILLPAAFILALTFVYPVGAADIFDYIMHARLLPVYHANPFTILPVQFKDDPFLQYIAWPYTTSAYGPLWELIAAAIGWLGGDSLWANLLYFKALAIISYFANALLIYFIVRRYNPAWLWRAMVFYLWNPLVLFEIATNGHNDLLMMTGVLAAIAALDWQRETLRYAGASAFLILGTLVKFLAAPFLPLLWIEASKLRGQSRQRRTVIIVVSVGVALLLAAAFYLPFFEPGKDILSAARRADMFTASVPNAVKISLEDSGFSAEMAATIARSIAIGLLGLFYIWQMWRLWRGRTTLVRAGFEVLFFYLLVSILWFQPWYLMWIVALAPLIPDWGVQVRTYAFCVTAMANYVVWDMLFFWVYHDINEVEWGSLYFVYPLPLLLSVGFIVYNWWQGRRACYPSPQPSPEMGEGEQPPPQPSPEMEEGEQFPPQPAPASAEAQP